MLLVPAPAAFAVPGDLAFGVVRADANKDNAITSAAIGEEDRGLAGVTVNALDAAGNVVATTTTGADGSWSILESAVTGGPATQIQIDTSTANGNVYSTHPAAAAPDNAFARAGGTNQAVAALPAPNTELNALVYPIFKLDAELLVDAAGLDGKQVYTGTEPFQGPDTEPGRDSGQDNARVRSSDIVAFNWSLTSESEDGSLGETFTGAVFEQTITLVDGAVANFASLPAVCDSVKSSIVALPSGTSIAPRVDPPTGTTSVVLSCVLGEMGSETKIMTTQVQPSAKSPNGSSFETSSRFIGVDGNGATTAQPDQGPAVPPIEITATPRYDVEKIQGSVGWTSQNVNGVPTYGMYAYYGIQIATDRQTGVEAFQQPIELEESFWANRTVGGPGGELVGAQIDDLKWYIISCSSNLSAPGSGAGIPAGQMVGGRLGTGANTEANSVRHSGACTPSRSGADTDSYTLTLDGIDTSGLTYPTHTMNGTPVPANKYYVASYRIMVFVPATEIDRLQDGPADGTGEMSISNRVGGFDPVGVSGAPNYGTGGEPGYCEPGAPGDQATNCDPMEGGARSNNVVGPATVRMPAAGTWSKYFYNLTTGWAGGQGFLPEASATGAGNGYVQPGQAFTTAINLTNQGVQPLAGAQMCDVFDNTVLELVPLASDATTVPTNPNAFEPGLYSAVLKIQNGSLVSVADQKAAQSNWVLKYGTVDLTGDDPNTGVFDAPTNRWEGNWTKQRAATNGANTVCGDPSMTWSDAPTADTNVVWLQAAPGYELAPQEGARWYLTFEQRNTYSGGPHDGEEIPGDTVAANFANVKTATWQPNWQTASYWPGAGYTAPFTSAENGRKAGESTSSQGDRWTVTRAVMALQKRTIALDVLGESSTGVSDYGITGAARAGKPVVWEINPTITAASDDPAPVQNVVITDTLPKYVNYDEAATQAIEGGTVPTSVTANADGTTTLVWNLGARVPNQPLGPLRIATYTDSMAPPNTVAVNHASITANGLAPLSHHSDDHTIRIEQDGQVQLKKTVDRALDLQDDDQQYTLLLKNFSANITIAAPTIYEVLPYNGDATNTANVNRTPGSAYAGTNRLNAAPEAFDFESTTPRNGTFYYTTVPGAQVPQRQQDDTDPAIWSTTFTPNATGFKFVSDSALTAATNTAKSGIQIVFRTDQAGNQPGDLYTNRFTATSPTMNNGDQLMTSNTVSVRVIGFSLGDFIWFDVNTDGKFDAGTDRAVPEGVVVQVRNAGGTVVATTTTLGGDQQGRWVVNNLAKGDYYVTIPASEFAVGGKLAGALPAPNPVADPNTDANEGTDHHAIADGTGLRSAGLISLGADESADPIAGEEPTGDNVAGLTLAPLTTDDFTNLTLDLALRPSATFTVAKAIDGDGAQYHADTEFDIEVTCALNGSNVRGYPQTVTLKGGESIELSAPMGANCEAVETDDGGATEVAIDPEDGVTLEFEPADPIAITVTNIFKMADFTVSKAVDGNGAHLHADTEFAITVDCLVDGESWAGGGYPQSITLTGGESESFTAPVGANCTAVETDTAGATEVVIDPAAGILLTDEEDAEFAITVTNTFEVGSFKILKELEGVGVGIQDSYEFGFTAVCTYRGAEVLNAPVTLTGDGSAALESEQFDDLPVGSECVITEIDSGRADETPAPAQITIDRDPSTVQIAGFVNEYSAGTIEFAKALAGDAAEDAFVQNLVFDVAVTCQLDVDGTLVDVYSGVLQVKGGETVAPEIDGEPVLVPLGSHCFGAETRTQGASDAVVDYGSYDNAAIVETGNVDEPQLLTLTAVNTFDKAVLTVSKMVVGPDMGESYTFELACTYPVTGEDGAVVQAAYPLADADARFTLKGGESRTIEVLKGVNCGVAETDAPAGATVTYLDSDDTTLGGEADGQVGGLVGTENSVDVTNTLELAKLTVSKQVVGPAPDGAEYTFELACTYHGSAGEVPFPLDPADAKFKLKHDESHTIEVLAGVDCAVIETNLPSGALVSIVDTDDSTDGGVKDGLISDLHAEGNAVEVTNTFQALSTTGGVFSGGVIVTALALLIVGAGILIVRLRRKEPELDE